MNNLFELLLYSGKAVGSVFLVTLAGVWLVRRKIVSREAMRIVSQMVFSLFLPCLLFVKMAESVSWTQLKEYWVFPFSCVVYICAGGALGQLLVRLCRPRREMANGVVAAVAFNNSGYLPIPLLLAVTAIFPAFAADPAAGDQAVAFVSVYLLGFSPMLWTIGYSMISGGKISDLSIRNIFPPPVIGMLAGIVVGLVPPLKEWCCSRQGPLNPVFQAAGVVAMATVPCALIVLGGGLSRGPAKDAVNPRTLFGVIAVKLIIFPLLALVYVAMLRKLGVLPANLLAALVLVVEAGSPPANNLAVIAALARPEMEDGMASILFWSYLASIVTLTGTIMIAMRVFG